MNKKQLITLAPFGWIYTGKGEHNGRVCYWYQAGDYTRGFREMRVYDEDLTEKNLDLMARLGMTR